MNWSFISFLLIFSLIAELGLAQRLDQESTKKTSKSQKSSPPILIIQPKYMRSEVVMMIPDARHTVYSAGYLGELGVNYFKAEEFRQKFSKGWKEFRQKALINATSVIKSVKPEYIKDSTGKIEYALIQSDNPSIVSSVNTQQFRDLFKENFGSDLWVIIPNRSTILVMQAGKNRLNTYKKAFYQMFLDATYPVSREVFLINSKGLWAIGDLKTPSQ